ncbi:HNH endonuclease [Candidatus Avelusimicrobium sp.]|uniref:HNH endonuclease n=1 Tax=Candidatus Avelusimicrobium sp. TaxID=3048833 RepID=UPI003D7E4C6E
MPDNEVQTIRDFILYQYAKIIAKSALKHKDGVQAKKASYGFIKKTFRQLRDNEKKWSDILREDWQLVNSEKKCIYCGSTENLSQEHIVPKTLLVNERCPHCDHIQGIHNLIWACESCNSAKGQKGLYTFFCQQHQGTKHPSDFLPPLLEKKYLKIIYLCHQCAGTLNNPLTNRDVCEIDSVVKNFATKKHLN